MSDLGLTQAKALAERLADHPFDSLYTSPRRRTRETAAILGARLRVTPVEQYELREVPSGLAALLCLIRLFAFSSALGSGGRVLVVTHGGTLRALLLFLGGWRSLPWLWRPVACCQPFTVRPSGKELGFAGPLVLFASGIAFGLFAVTGPWPGPFTFSSYAFALLTYGLMSRLAQRGFGCLGIALLAGLALAIAPLSFGPSPLDNRKVMPFNAWAYALGDQLPAIVSPAPNPNGLAGLLAAALGLAGAVFLFSRGWRRKAAAVAALLLGGMLVLTASRAGWLAGLVALLALVKARGSRQRWGAIALAGMVISLSVLLIGKAQPDEIGLFSPRSLMLRAEQWGQTVSLLQERPLTGLGLARFPEAYGEAVAGTGRRSFKTPNNLFLETWTDAGILGVIALAWMTFRARRMLRDLGAEGEISSAWPAIGLSAALTAFAVHGVFEANSVIVWAAGAGFGHLASPLPYALLGLLSGAGHKSKSVASSGNSPM